MDTEKKENPVDGFTQAQQKVLKIASIAVVVSAVVFIVGLAMIIYALLIFNHAI